MYIIQPAACTAVDKKQNDMLTDHPCRDSLLILNVAFLFLSVVCFVLLGSSQFIFTVWLKIVIEVGWKGKITCVRNTSVMDAGLFFFISVFLTASIKTLYAAFFSYSDNLGNFLKTLNWWTFMYKQCCWNTLNFWNYAPWKLSTLRLFNFLSNEYELQSGLDKSGFEVRSFMCQEDNCVRVCSELLGYLAKIWIIILLLLLLGWVARIRFESEALPHFRATGFYHCWCTCRNI